MKAVAVYNAQKQWNTSIKNSEREKIEQEKTNEPKLVDAKDSQPQAIPIMFPLKSRTISAMSRITETSVAEIDTQATPKRELDQILKDQNSNFQYRLMNPPRVSIKVVTPRSKLKQAQTIPNEISEDIQFK